VNSTLVLLTTLLLAPLATICGATQPDPIPPVRTDLPQVEKFNGKPYNVLFIAIDDLNDWVGAFGGAPQAQSATPRMDKFAQNGAVVFQQANCAGPVCCPSRSALLSGFMPNRSGIYGNSQNMLNSRIVQTHYTLPEYFSKHGYRTLSTGKIFHKHAGDDGQWAFDEWAPTQGGLGSQVDPDHLTSANRKLVDGKPATFGSAQASGKSKENDTGDGEGVDFAWGPTKGPKEESRDWESGGLGGGATGQAIR
jgi:arylsulfatase A-like enzyme